MDHRQKMIVIPQQSKIKVEDDDDEDVEALRLAALKSLRTKNAMHKKLELSQMQKVLPQITQSSRFPYKNQRSMKKNYYHNRVQQRQNGNLYYQSHRNPNLIAIVPVDEPSSLQQVQLACPVEKTESCVESCPQEVSKFHRFKDSGSASEEEDVKEQKSVVTSIKTEITSTEESVEFSVEVESQEEITENLQKNGEKNEREEDGNDDDDDILLMADLEEEDSLERLMDEMEREMNDENKVSEKGEKKLHKDCETKNTIKSDEGSKNLDQKTKSDDSYGKKERNNVITPSLTTIIKNDRRSVSPHITNRIIQKRRSLSPRSRSRKKSPRRSPRRSPIRLKKSPREALTRYRSPPLSRYSPRSRSPRLSPRRSPNRTIMKKSPLRKLSPRGRSPKLSSRSRSPRPHRSRSPRRSKSPRPRSPKISRSRTPRLSRSSSPRYSPLRSPRSKSPRLSPRRVSPRRLRSRSRSLGLSPQRGSSRLRSPKTSPHRTPSRLRSPRLSPRRSPWSSPRHSPRLSPRRKRSPKWSPKELPRKHGPRSITPDNRDGYVRESSPIFKSTAEIPRTKAKQKDEAYERPTMMTEIVKESVDIISDPILEARKKKFESMRPIDPVNANKRIKLSKKHTTNTKVEPSEKAEIHLSNARKVNKTVEEYDTQEMDLCLEEDYEFEECEDTMENTSPSTFTSTISIEAEPQKIEKEKSSKKKKKRDKELYQVGKLKNELPLSERIGKDKKCKKRKDIVSEDVDVMFEDITIDEEGDLRAELSRRRAERLNRTLPIQSARLVQSAFKGVVNEAVKNNAKANQRHLINTDEKPNQKEVRRVTVLHRSLTELHDSEDESTLDSKVPVRLRLGLNKQVQESRESKVTRKATKRQGRKVKHKNHLSLKDPEYIL
ncbi:PREDICTED: serine/arginine repetitive matrix protein 1-like [Cyphomyrmex costatus]|uniref:serine/arginine repetitive matrix protein 1-like n=1 Tax=Cyphomyrmex costatus TaxID=456900 RepID=UPI0008523061|nr:PREDICTED: serine/arginine repetitive matrix protein 1-like [Cyphomyrmex costatus]